MSIVCNGLLRAIDNYSDRYKTIRKIVNKYMRDYITSIYLVKAA
jgi:hypothetical protein